MKLLKEYLKWICNKDVAVVIGSILFFIVPFTVLCYIHSNWDVVWFIFSEIVILSFNFFYFDKYKKKINKN